MLFVGTPFFLGTLLSSDKPPLVFTVVGSFLFFGGIACYVAFTYLYFTRRKFLFPAEQQLKNTRSSGSFYANIIFLRFLFDWHQKVRLIV